MMGPSLRHAKSMVTPLCYSALAEFALIAESLAPFTGEEA